MSEFDTDREQAGAILGMSAEGVRKRENSGDLRGQKIKGKVFFRRADVDALKVTIASGRPMPTVSSIAVRSRREHEREHERQLAEIYADAEATRAKTESARLAANAAEEAERAREKSVMGAWRDETLSSAQAVAQFGGTRLARLVRKGSVRVVPQPIPSNGWFVSEISPRYNREDCIRETAYIAEMTEIAGEHVPDLTLESLIDSYKQYGVDPPKPREREELPFNAYRRWATR